MQIDMHYHGTYAMAILAGLNERAAHIVATSSQFVDDCASRQQIKFRDAGQIDSQATAHHTFDVTNIDFDDQRQVWVPFHFLPGNEGNSFTQRLVCRKDSPIAQEMVRNALQQLNSPEGLFRLGVTAHVYADTFAHYGFSGVSSRANKVDNESIKFGALDPDIKDYIVEKAGRFSGKYNGVLNALGNIKSWIAENGSFALGHGAVATYPDRPYLNWSFVYEVPEVPSGERNNPESFLEACEKLHGMFHEASSSRPDLRGGSYTSFDEIRGNVRSVLEFQAKGDDRCNKWMSSSVDGVFGHRFEIPPYEGAGWNSELQDLDNTDDSGIALSSKAYLFFRAASAHRQYVLRDLLPNNGLIVA